MALSVFSDEHFMKQALREAELAAAEGEVPVGAVVVCENQIIARAHNQTERLQDVTAHAEMIALTSASNFLGSKYLDECTLYVTLEPCLMCGGAIYWSQLQKLVIAAEDHQKGFSHKGTQVLHPKTEFQKGVLEQESKDLLMEFFSRIRE